MKKIGILILMLLSFLSLVYADNTTDNTTNNTWDCWSINLPSWEAEWTGVESNMIKAMPKKSLEKAKEHLDKYCCDIWALNDCTETNDKTLYPESVYIFDHIFDIYLRSLDAKDELLYGLDADWSGREWRDYITSIGNNVKGLQPLEIKSKYEEFWKWTRYVPSYSDSDMVMLELWENSITWHISQYDDWSLRDKYNLACDLVSRITTAVMGSWLTKAEYDSCKEITNIRIDRENAYVKTLLMQKANKLLWSNMNSYLQTYFVRTKLSNLDDILFNMNTSFFEITDAVEKLVKNCS